MSIEIAVLALALMAVALIGVYTVTTGIPPVPTSARVRAVMLRVLPPRIEGTIFELGSGWGTLAFPLARRYPECRVMAYEVSPLPWLVSRLRLALSPLPNLVLNRANFDTAPLGEASLVVCYLFPGAMAKLKTRFGNELATGTMVLSNTFAVPGWQPAVELAADDLYGSKVYLYRTH